LAANPSRGATSAKVRPSSRWSRRASSTSIGGVGRGIFTGDAILVPWALAGQGARSATCVELAPGPPSPREIAALVELGRPRDRRRSVETSDPIEAARRRELESEIQRALSRLSPKLHTIIVLRYVENLSYQELAETLRIPLGTVRSRLARAHEALDRELTPLLDKYWTET
jgi:RNA polymerase sigma factor (sigma-70 family)